LLENQKYFSFRCITSYKPLNVLRIGYLKKIVYSLVICIKLIQEQSSTTRQKLVNLIATV
jgi:hypothetical protein